VICRAVGGVHWRLVNTIRYVCVAVVCAWCHSESFLSSIHPSLRILSNGELHVDGLPFFGELS